MGCLTAATTILSFAALGKIAIALGQVPATFQSTVAYVSVDVAVFDKRTGGPVDKLTVRDFELFQDGVPQKLAACHYEEAPLDFVIAVDVSGSARTAVRELVSTAERGAVRCVRRQDRVAVLSFSSNLRLVLPFTDDPNEVVQALKKTVSEATRVERGTRLYDATVFAAEMFERPLPIDRRRAILVLTDDREAGSKSNLHQVIAAVSDAHASVYGITLPTGDHYVFQTSERLGLPIPRLPRLNREVLVGPQHSSKSIVPVVESSGGETICGSEQSDALAKSLERLRQRYQLTYYPEMGTLSPATRHTLRVQLSPRARIEYPDALVRHRTGFIVD